MRVPPDPANDQLLVVDLYLRPGGAVAGEHLHPSSTETFTVVRGRLNVPHDGRELQADPGTRVEVQPGERVAQVVRQLFLLAQDGKTSPSGRPRPLEAAALAWEFADTIRFTSPPRLVQRVLSGILYPLARATGHRGLDPDLLGRELPVVDLEPIPAELRARIPASPPTRPGPAPAGRVNPTRLR